MGKDPNPSNAVEFIDENGNRWAWSESNCQYESVPEDGASFTLLRKRLLTNEAQAKCGHNGNSCLKCAWTKS